jgi:hypothetical protein
VVGLSKGGGVVVVVFDASDMVGLWKGGGVIVDVL